MKTPKGFSVILIIAIGAIIATFGWIAYATWQQSVDDSNLTLTLPPVKHKAKNANTDNAANTNSAVNTNTNANTNVSTAGWKTYTNATYLYSVKYPGTYTQTGTAKKMQLQKGELAGNTTHRVLVYTYDGTEQGWTTEEKGWFTWALQGFPTSTTFANKRTVKLGENTFTVFDFDPASGGGLTVDYFLVKGSIVYLLSDFRVGDHTNDTNKDIIATFTPDETLGWKTYTSTAYHFSIRYPSDWQAVEDSSTSPFHINLSRKSGTSQGGITILARYPNSTSGVGGNDNATSTTKKVTIGGKSATEYNWTDKRNGQPINRAIIFDELPLDWPDDNPTLEPSNTGRYISVGPAADGSYSFVDQVLSTFQFTK